MSLDTWLDQNLLVVKSEGMCALSHLPDGPLTSLSNACSPCSGDEVQSSRPSTILVSMVCLICQIAASTTMCERSLVPSFMIRSWWDLDSPGDRNNPLATFRVVLGPETIKYKTELTAPLFGHPDTSDNNNSRAELPRPQFWLSPWGHLGSSRALGTLGNPSHLRTKASTSPPVW